MISTTPAAPAAGGDAQRLAALYARERQRYVDTHPRSAALAAASQPHFLWGLPLHWMRDWALPHPLFVEQASGNRLRCVDGVEHIDFCLGDSGALFGHSPPALARALTAQGARGADRDAARQRAGRGRRVAAARLRAAALAARAQRQRRQPLRAALGTRAHRPPPGAGLRRRLPRQRRRHPGRARARRPSASRWRRRRCSSTRPARPQRSGRGESLPWPHRSPTRSGRRSRRTAARQRRGSGASSASEPMSRRGT